MYKPLLISIFQFFFQEQAYPDGFLGQNSCRNRPFYGQNDVLAIFEGLQAIWYVLMKVRKYYEDIKQKILNELCFFQVNRFPIKINSFVIHVYTRSLPLIPLTSAVIQNHLMLKKFQSLSRYDINLNSRTHNCELIIAVKDSQFLNVRAQLS